MYDMFYSKLDADSGELHYLLYWCKINAFFSNIVFSILYLCENNVNAVKYVALVKIRTPHCIFSASSRGDKTPLPAADHRRRHRPRGSPCRSRGGCAYI